MPQGVLIGGPAGVFSFLIRGDFRQVVRFGGRHDVQGQRGERRLVLQHDDNLAVGPETQPLEAETAILGSPGKHIAPAGGQEGPALGVGVFLDGRVEFRIVVDHKIHAGAVHGLAVFILHLQVDPGRGSIVVDQVDLGEIRTFEHHLFRPLIMSEDLGMHQQGAAGRTVEPTQVEDSLRFAGAHKMPLPVRPGFDPGVVVVGMGPAGRINLAGRDADRAQSRDRKSGFFPAAAEGILDGIQRRTRPRIGRLVGHLFVAPMINFEDGLGHRQALHAGLQFPEKHHPRGIQVLVVDADGKDEVAEDHFGDFRAPGEGLAGLERGPDILQVKICRIIRYIGQRHIGVQELQGLLFRHRYFTVVNITIVTGKACFAVIEGQEGAQGAIVVRQAPVQGTADGSQVRAVRNEVPSGGAVVAGNQAEGQNQQGEKSSHLRDFFTLKDKDKFRDSLSLQKTQRNALFRHRPCL